MSSIARPVNSHQHYHAHLYYNSQTQPMALQILQTVADELGLKVGSRHEKLVGPHPQWSCQISFNSSDFDQLIPWLEAHRSGLTVLVHPLTDNDLRDHTELATWLGEPADLALDLFR